jgi:exodeoxyribonuclease VII large subunit
MIEAISVSQYLDKVNISLKKEKVRIMGEVFDFKMAPAWTFIYFSMKDKNDGSVLCCIIDKNDYRLSGVELSDGREIIVSGYPGIYKKKGEFKLRAETVELVGDGALKIEYEKLKKKLESEGLFASERKRKIPDYPHKIGVITSRSGAVINDFLTNIGKFGFEILFVDSKVEGQEAVKDLLSAINTLKTKDIDVLVMMRGGGSLEAFLAFNNEAVVRAIAEFPVPTLTGIGHDKDEPLVSMVSDKNVSTPTAVANLLNSSWNYALSLVNIGEERIISRFDSLIRDKKFLIENSIVRMESNIKFVKDIIENRSREIVERFSNLLKNAIQFLDQSKKSIELLNPERQLAQGYSIVRFKGKVLKSKKGIKTGDELDIKVSDGIIQTQTI